MATLHRSALGAPGTVYVKGAVEKLVGPCTTQLGANGRAEPLDAATVLARADELAGQALRVLAFGRADVGPDVAGLSDEGVAAIGLCFVGLQAMHDPPRPEASPRWPPARPPGSRSR